MSDTTLRDCPDCAVKPGELHQPGCDCERCALCGEQVISCDCVYHLNGMALDDMEQLHPDVYQDGPTDEMLAVYDAEVERRGGRIPWSGDWDL